MATARAFIFRLESLIPGAGELGRRWPGEASPDRERWVEEAEKTLQPIAGTTEFLRARRGSGSLAIVTCLPLKAGGELIKTMNWRGVFDVFIGAEHGSGEPLAMIGTAVKRLRREPGHCVVFDTESAWIRAARGAQTRVCAIGRGFQGLRLRLAGAEWVAPDLTRLPEAVAGRQA